MNIEEKIEKKYNILLNHFNKIIPSTTYDYQLRNICKKLFKSNFIDVLSYDKINEKNLKNNKSMIINVDSSNMPGSHWISLYRYNDKIILYDSFGRDINKLIPKLKDIFKNKELIFDTKDKEQKYNEYNCGARSIIFLIICYDYGYEKALLI